MLPPLVNAFFVSAERPVDLGRVSADTQIRGWYMVA